MAEHVRTLHYILIGVIGCMALHSTWDVARDYQLVERYFAIIIASMLTEQIQEKFKIEFDYGPLSYICALIYPPFFSITSYAIKMHTTEIPVYSELQAMVLGTEYTIRFRKDVDFNNIMSEHRAVTDIQEVVRHTRNSHYLRESFIGLALLMAFILMHGKHGVMIAAIFFACYLMVQTQKGKEEKTFTQDVKPMSGRRGVYAIETSNLWAQHHVGVGYLQDGTFTTKYHITNGKPIIVDGELYQASYYNTETDIVTYGAPPSMVDVSDGDNIVVALSGPYSDVIVNYTTQVSITPNGYILFAGRKSIPGTSGSPFFKETRDSDGNLSYKFAGCIGWAHNSQQVASNEIIEIAKNSGVGDNNLISRGEIVQVIKHPGSGKTRDIAKVIQSGLNTYGRVYAAGPTRGVANELLKAYEANPIEGLHPRVLIKDTKKARSPSKLTISTHGTLLNMLLKRDSSVTQPGLWILDESHFPDRNTQALKHYLRHNITTGEIKGSLYEMTATAYDIKAGRWVYADASNYPIKDTIMQIEDMVKAILEDERKIIVFVTAIEGIKKTTSQSLAQELRSRGKRVIEINRSNFTTAYPLAKKGDFDVILTTNISECGVNLDVDACYDFQRNPRPMVYDWNDVRMTSDSITVGQYVQRRGRVGRRKEGEYIAPDTKHQLLDVRTHDVMNLDVALFIKNFNIKPMEPTFLNEEASNYSCSHEQIMYIFAGGESHTIQSFLTLQMVIDGSGRARESEDLLNHVRKWHDTANVERNEGNRVVTAQYWDDRDSQFYWQWKNIIEMQPPGKTEVPFNMRKKIHALYKAIRHRGMWIKKREDETPLPSDEEIEEEAESSS